MRAVTLVKTCVVVMFIASIGVAGTTVVMKTAETFLAETELLPTADEVMPVQVDDLQRQLRSYQVRLNAAGELEGRISIVSATGIAGTAREMTIAFLQSGSVIKEVHPGIEGKFRVSGLAPGVYSVVGAGPDGYVAYGLHILPAELTVENGKSTAFQPVVFQEVMDELAIDSVAVPVSDLPTVLSLARNNIPPEYLTPNPSGEALQPGAEIPDFDAEFTNNRKDVALSGHQVRIQPDGRLVGRIHRINQNGEPTRIRRMNVFLVQNNQRVAQAPVTELGTFEFFDVPEGIYSFIAAGAEGLAAFTMQAVSGPGLAADVKDEITLVSFNMNGESGAGATVNPDDADEAIDRGEDANDGGDGTGTGTGAGEGGELGELGEGGGESGGGGSGGGGLGGGGPAGGGGGFGDGGLGLGGVLGLAGLTAAGIALADDDGNNVISPLAP